MKRRTIEAIAAAHEALTRFYAELDGVGRFREEDWSRDGGGGGVSRVMTNGALFEKVGANRALVHGEFTAAMAAHLLLPAPPAGARFFATGLSTIAHPLSPKIPTVHMNARYLEIVGRDGAVLDAWFGGVVDLTPTYPLPDDAALFHRELERLCGAHGRNLYADFKPACDAYFANHHRGGEARGVGGIFFDHLRPGDRGLDADALLAFVSDVAAALPRVFGPLARAGVNVDMIVQTAADEDKTTEITFTVNKIELDCAQKVLEVESGKIGYAKMIAKDDVSKISLVGIGMRSHAGVAATMFETLAEKGINIDVIETSEINISVLIASEYTELALRSLHTVYGLDAK